VEFKEIEWKDRDWIGTVDGLNVNTSMILGVP